MRFTTNDVKEVWDNVSNEGLVVYGNDQTVCIDFYTEDDDIYENIIELAPEQAYLLGRALVDVAQSNMEIDNGTDWSENI